MQKSILLCWYCIVMCMYIQAQTIHPLVYPQNYFRNPLSIPIELSGNFGHIRNNHFHMGIDLRTQQKENLPVFAAASGYISRIKIEHYGYGRAIYITHHNGYTTVYGHLNNFYDTLQQFVTNKQYNNKQWEQDIYFLPNQFVVAKGQFIAYSGNTGGSGGPHLHFEIRQTINNEIKNINPLLFDFEIPDHVAPRIKNLFWYDRRYSTYFTNTHLINLQSTDSGLVVTDSVVKVGSNKLSFGICADDKTDESPNFYGIYSAAVIIDSTLTNGFQLNDISTNKSSYINACIDYPYLINNQKGIQHLSKIGNNYLYNQIKFQQPIIANPSFLELKDTLVHLVKIIVKDIANNTSNIQFNLQYQPSVDTIFIPKNSTIHLPQLFNTNYPTKQTDSTVQQIKVTAKTLATTVFDTALIDITQTKRNGFPYASNLLQIGDYHIPVEDPYQISIPLHNIALQYPNQLIVRASNNIATETKHIKIESSSASTLLKANTELNLFGLVEVLIDTIAPSITPVNFPKKNLFINTNQLIVKVKDNYSAIKNFTAQLDNQWLLFSRKNNYYIYTFDEHCKLGNHILTITATDACNNTIVKQFNFTKALPIKKQLVKKRNNKKLKK